MPDRPRPSLFLSSLAGLLSLLFGSIDVREDLPVSFWPQWGGATRDFKAAGEALADTWPSEGPKRVWTCKLGEEYAGVAGHGNMLYTVYRDGGDEVVVALSAADGHEVWQDRGKVPIYEEETSQFGNGPNATPLLLGGCLVAAGFTGVIRALDAETGRPIW